MGLFGGFFKNFNEVNPETGLSWADKLGAAGSILQGDQDAATNVAARGRANLLAKKQQSALSQLFNGGGDQGGGFAEIAAPEPVAPSAGFSAMFGGGGEGAPQSAPQAAPLRIPTASASPPRLPSLRNPQTKRQLAALAQSGYNVSGVLDLLKASDATDKVEVANGVAYNPYDARAGDRIGVNLQNVNGFQIDTQDPGNAGKYLPEAPAKGSEPVYDRGGNPIGWRMMDGSIQALQQSASAQASGEAAGRAPYDLVDVPRSDGSSQKMTRQQYLGLLSGDGVPPVPPRITGTGGVFGPPVSAPRLGVTQSPGEKVSAEIDARTATDLLGSAAQMYSDARANLNGARTAFAYANGLDPNAFTGAAATVAKYLAPLGVRGAEQLATNATTYKQSLAGELKNLARTFPGSQSDKELKAIQDMVPSISTPREATMVFLAGRAAGEARRQAYAEFLTNYNGPRTPQAIQRAWTASPQGRTSMFQDPIWQQVNINGRPAVEIAPRQDAQGRRWGVFRRGTPYRINFQVR